MGIEVKTEEENWTVNEESFSDSMQNLDNMLAPGTLVMLRNYHYSNHKMGGGKSSDNILFFSGGELLRDGSLNIQSGKRNAVFAMINENAPSPCVLFNWDEEYLCKKVSLPSGGLWDHYNEGTFSQAGGVYITTEHSAGTEEIIVGSVLEDQYPDEVRALRFAGDAISFYLHPVYLMQDKMVYEGGESKDQQYQRVEQSNTMGRLGACMALMDEVRREEGRNTNPITAYQLRWFAERTRESVRRDLPVDDKDYLVQEGGPYNRAAFVKTETGNHGRAYTLPFNEKSEDLVETAFSPDIVRKIFPYGMDRQSG